MAVTLKDVAKYAGTSTATASKVISGKPMRISEETRARVLAAAYELNYTPNAAGANLRKGYTNMVAVIVGDLLYPYNDKLLKRLIHQLRQRGKQMVVCNTDNDFSIEKDYYELLKTGYVDAVLVIPSPATMTKENIQKSRTMLSALSIPVVVICGNGEQLYPDFPSVGTDRYASGCIATEHLVAMGHRNIAFVSEMEELSELNLKYAGYADTLKKHGIPLRPELVQLGYCRYVGGYQVYQVLKDQGATAAIFSSDMLSVGFSTAVRDNGGSIPRDWSIIGMDNIMATEHNYPRITTINQDVDALAEATMQLLFLNGQLRPPRSEDRVQHLNLIPEILTRDSCAPPAEWGRV